MTTGRSVLVVEDDESMMEYCSAILDLEGFRVTAAPNGEKALAQIKAGRFDIVLTDHVTVESDGRSMAEIVKSFSPDTEVIVMSGMPTVENELTSFLAGARDYLAKPFTLDQLRDAVRKCLPAPCVNGAGVPPPLTTGSGLPAA